MNEVEIGTYQKISGKFADFRGIAFAVLGHHFNNCQYVDTLGL